MSRVEGIAVKYTDRLAPSEGTVAAHAEVLNNRGYVWFGKVGRRIGADRAEVLKEQSRHGTRTFLVLVRTTQQPFTFHLCEIDDILFDLPRDELAAAPDYYARLESPPSTWFRVTRILPLDSSLASDITVTSSGAPLSSAVRKGAVHFVHTDERVLTAATSEADLT